MPTNLQVFTGGTMKNPATGQCLDDPGASTNNFTALDLTSCSSGNAVKWTPTGGMALSGDFPQQWALTYHNTSKTGFFEITSPNLGNITGAWCIEPAGVATADGTAVQYWGCNQTAVQYWQYDASSKTIVNVESGKCLSTQGGSTAAGTQLVIRTCDGGADQKWTVPAS